MALDEARAVEVGEHAADGGQGQAEPGGQLADGDRVAEELLERGDVPRLTLQVTVYMVPVSK